MAGINKVIIVGNLGDKPELKHTGAGKPVTNISVATSDGWNDKETNERIERTEWHRVSIFGPIAKNVCEYLDKGSKVYVEGKLQTRKWSDDKGIDRWTTEILVSGYDAKIEFLDKRSSGSRDARPPTDYGYEDMSKFKPMQPDEDDIPF
tara:strand:- start:1403 stop:1849 length:447 start_codon:yes stop_codon:yes gene_type:complete